MAISDTIKQGVIRAPHRSLLRATGVVKSEADFNKPFIAVCNSFVQIIPGHAHLDVVGKKVRDAIYAAGVQFPPVHLNGKTFLPGQANNFYIFPAVGMAIFATQAKRVTDEMFIEAGQAVAL